MVGTVGDRGSRLKLVLAFTFALVVGLAGSSLQAPPVTVAASSLAPWNGGIDLYRAGVFSTQRTWLWCTAADIQIIRNIVTGQDDHSKSGQQAYFDYMRAHDRYELPLKDGVDAAGWTAGLRKFVDPRYTLYESRSFDAALASAVTNLRRTSLPVAITVDHGNHAWIITGFTATADPAVTSRFTVTSVRVTGPLWGLQDRTFGYDMKPDTRLTPKQLEGFFTSWHYAPIKMAWEGRWVSIQPVPAKPATVPAAAASKPPPAPTAAPAALIDPRAELDVVSRAIARPTQGPEAPAVVTSNAPLPTPVVATPGPERQQSGPGAWTVVALLVLVLIAGTAMRAARRIR